MAYLNTQIKQNIPYLERLINFVKFRIFDILLIIFALIIIAPVAVIIAILVKTTSKGPVLFAQVRYGQNQTKFTIYKFRTMAASESHKQFSQCLEGDQRVTKLGRMLRKFSLDELPQLYNVLKNDMSIVGPRPHAVQMDDEYLKYIPNYAQRFTVKPGLTGLAQIRGHRGPTDSLDKILNRIQADCEYSNKKSFITNLRILLLTFPALFKPQNSI